MASHISSRVIAPPSHWVELPSLLHPQYVTYDGYELDEPIDEDVDFDMPRNEDAGVAGEDDAPQPELETDDEPMEVEGDMGEPLLSISESLVFAQSLKQSRQRHMNRLLPLIFTHPPLPSYQKPRARGPPKSSFTFPTLEAPAAPLPYREYHGPRKPDGAAGDPGSPGGAKGDDGKSTSTIRSQARAKRAAELDEVAPAHETECIARVTLSIGAFSYPETEIWIGRFVEPRAEVGKAIKADKKARVLAGEVEVPKKRPLPPSKPDSPANLINKPLAGGTGIPYRSFQHNSSAGPSNVRPMTSSTTAQGGPSGAPKPAPRPEGAIKVNLAAATRPWLSDIIHKAARKQASKEELARLGRAVGRLTRGEDVDGSETATPATSTIPASAVPSRLAANSGTSSPLTSEVDSESDLSDLGDEAAMKGPKQVGGGPASGVEPTPPNMGPRPTSPRVPTPFAHFTSTAVRPQAGPTRPTAGPSGPPLGTNFPRPPPLGTNFPRPPPPSYHVPAHLAPYKAPFPPQSTISMAPPPPRPVYPKVPPFLFLAFKESPTEKYLIPLGANSFISRVGGDHVTHPAPPTIAPPVAPVVAPLAHAEPLAPDSEPPMPLIPAGPAGRRTRASLGQSAKAGKSAAKAEVKAKTPSPEPAEPTVTAAVPSRPIAPSPKAGTVAIDTLMPTGVWEMPDWAVLEKGLPWNNPTPPFIPGLRASQHQSASITATGPVHENRDASGNPTPFPSATPSTLPRPEMPSPPTMLNLGAIDFTPAVGDLEPVSIRLSGLDDYAWMKMKQVIELVEVLEVGALARKEPDLRQAAESPLIDVKDKNNGTGSKEYTPQQNARRVHLERKKARFSRLLSRAPTRSFLRFRTEYLDPALVDSLADKWAPRPYAITTKSLYARSPPPDDEGERAQFARPSPERPAKKRRSNVHEPAVAFEMPMSLDALDERVEEGAKFALGRRGRPKGPRKSGAGRPRKERTSDAAEIDVEGQKKVRRGKSGAICEGCASTSLKVWRKGPGGRGTLCKDCGDAYNAGTLGELKAPGAMTNTAAQAPSPALDVKLGSRIEDHDEEAPQSLSGAGSNGGGQLLDAPIAVPPASTILPQQGSTSTVAEGWAAISGVPASGDRQDTGRGMDVE